jgi:hypothetical protein
MLAHDMAFASPFITSFAVEATEFPDLARRHRVSAVPKTVVNDDREVLGALPEPAFIEQALAGVVPADSENPDAAKPEA